LILCYFDFGKHLTISQVTNNLMILCEGVSYHTLLIDGLPNIELLCENNEAVLRIHYVFTLIFLFSFE